MKIVSDDGRFEAEIAKGIVNLRIHLQDFEGEFTAKEFPKKVKEFQKSLAEIASKVELVAGLFKRNLHGD